MFNITGLYNSLISLVLNNLNQIITFIGLFLGSIIIVKVFEKIILVRIKKIAKKTTIKFDDLIIEIIDSVKWPFYIVFALFLASRFVELYGKLDLYIYYLFLLILVYYITKGIQSIINFCAKRLLEKEREKGNDSLDPSAILLLKRIAIGLVWGIAIILLLQNFGYNVSALVAGLGVGGIAIAFALQNILGDFFAAFSIYFDKPFETGDYIVVGDDSGTVKKIGIKSTRIQTLRGEELVVSNKKLTDMKIHNFKKMDKRRANFTLGLGYSTSNKKLKKAKVIIEEIIEKLEGVELDRVNFTSFGDFSLDFEIVYYLDSREYSFYMDKQGEINFKIKEKLEEEGINIPYPTQTLNINKNE